MHLGLRRTVMRRGRDGSSFGATSPHRATGRADGSPAPSILLFDSHQVELYPTPNRSDPQCNVSLAFFDLALVGYRLNFSIVSPLVVIVALPLVVYHSRSGYPYVSTLAINS